MKDTKVAITVMIESKGENNHYQDHITTDNIIAAVEFYNKTMNQLDQVDYNDFPVFKDECSEVDYHNTIADSVAKRILEHFDDPRGVFGGDKLNEICKRYYKMKNERNLYFRLLTFLLICLGLFLYGMYGGLC